MCGRIASNISGAEQILEQFGLRSLSVDFQPRYNIAPGQDVLAVTQNRQGERQATYLRWGLLPAWAKDPAIANKMINARAETVAEKPSFSLALRHRRCVIPATGFYEWLHHGKQKTPYYLSLESGAPMALAGLWEEWHGPQALITRSFTVLTTQANSLVEPIHNRMPVIVRPEMLDAWLDHSVYDLPLLTQMMQPYPAEGMSAHAVSDLVNSPQHDVPACIAPVAV